MPNFRKSFADSVFDRFLKQNNGSTVIVVAVVLVVLIGVLMLTVDLSRMQSGSTNNQAAIDASTLATAEYIARYRIQHQNQGEPADTNDYARKALLVNLSNDQSDATLASNDDFSVTVDNSTISVNACLTVKTGFAASIGNGGVHKVCSTSKASLPGAGNVEIVFALDISGSMLQTCTNCNGQTKIQALRQSVDSLMDYYSTYNNIYWGVVPYTGFIDLGNFASNIVDNDLNSGEPNDKLQPYSFHFSYISDNPDDHWDYTHKFNGIEDQYDYGGLEFDPSNPNALESMQRIPLTSRQGDMHPEDNSTITFDDDPPEAGHKFQAYWHQPYDFFMLYDADNDQSNPNNKACGTCFNTVISKSTYTDPSNHTGDNNPCQSAYDNNPCTVDPDGCGGGGGPTGPGPVVGE